MNISLGNYYPGNSFLHRLDPRLKFVFSLVFMFLLFLLNSPVAIAGYALFLTTVIALSGIPVKLVLKSLKSVLFIALFAFVINIFAIQGETILKIGPLSVSRAGLELGIRMAVRLFFLILTTSLFLTLSTTPLMIADAIESLLKPLARFGFPSHELAMMMSIALRFVPTLIEETDKIMKAQSSRGADYDTGGVFARARGLVSVLIPLFVSAFKRADDLAVAMEARCYRGAEGRTKMKELLYQKSDAVAGSAFALVATLLLLMEYLL